MSELKIIEIVLGILSVVSLGELYIIFTLSKKLEQNEDLVYKIGYTVIEKDIKNLFGNVKNETKKDDKNKLKNNRRAA